MPASLSSAVYSLKTIAFCTMSGVKMMNCIIEDHLVFVMGIYEGRTESHEQLFFACELETADEEDCGGR